MPPFDGEFDISGFRVPRSVRTDIIKWIQLLQSSRCRISFILIWYGFIVAGSILPAWKARFHTHERHQDVRRHPGQFPCA